MVLVRAADAADVEAIASVRHWAWLTAYRGVICGEYLDAMTLEESKAIIYDALVEKKKIFSPPLTTPEMSLGFVRPGRSVLDVSIATANFTPSTF